MNIKARLYPLNSVLSKNMTLFIEMRFLGLKNMKTHHTLYLQKKKQCASIKALIENRLNTPPTISTNTRQKVLFSFLV